MTEIQNVRNLINQVNAQGVDAARDIVKAVRVGYKAETAPGASNGNLGTIKVECKSEDARAKIMKTKNNLKNHPDSILKRIVIQNLKSREEMKAENFNYDILKLVTNSSDYYIGGNGHIRQKGQNQPRPNLNAPPPPPHYQSQSRMANPMNRPMAPPMIRPMANLTTTQFRQNAPAPPHNTYPPVNTRNSDPLENLFSFDSIPNPSQLQQPHLPAQAVPVGQPGEGVVGHRTGDAQVPQQQQ